MEFQLTNTCNLECVMCSGLLSSAIRANRDKLPAIPNKFDDAFIKQLEEFIPHLKYTTFSGGEPFLIKTYYDIWERFASINNTCTIKVITNGTIYNERVEKILEKNRFYITISLDSPYKETYESIRKGASFDEVMENAGKFQAYCKSKKTEFNFNFCPMTNNWQEVPDFIRLCNSMDIVCHFNMVYKPARYALPNLPSYELRKIADVWRAEVFREKTAATVKNKRLLDEYLAQVDEWAQQNERFARYTRLDPTEIIEFIRNKIAYYEKQGQITEGNIILEKLQPVIVAENLEGVSVISFYNSLHLLNAYGLQQIKQMESAEILQLMRKQMESEQW
jgi:MoaA/NifB/PqqE/SkfB family radical SAM enzyme